MADEQVEVVEEIQQDPEEVEETPSEETSQEKETPPDSTELLERVSRLEKDKESMQSRIDQLTFEKKTLQEQGQDQKSKTWEDLSIDELKVHRERFLDEGDMRKVLAVQDLINDKVAKGQTEQLTASRKQERERENSARQAWGEVQQTFSVTKDEDFNAEKEDSRVIQIARKIIQENPYLDDLEKYPQGHAFAIKEAHRILVVEKLGKIQSGTRSLKKKALSAEAKTGLEETGSPAGEEGSLDKELDGLQGIDPYDPRVAQTLRKLNKKAGAGHGI